MIKYNVDVNPTEVGVYACRIPHATVNGLLEDKFLMWFDGRWSHIGSDQRYRGIVAGWIGSLQRRID